MSIAVIRNIDSQGRIIIPADIRKEIGIQNGSTLEIASDGTTIRIQKCVPHISYLKELREYLETLYKSIGYGIALCDLETILISKGCYLPEGAKITPEIQHCIQKATAQVFTDSFYPPVSGCALNVGAIFPITLTSPFNQAGLLLLLKRGQSVSGDILGCAQLIANMITNKYKKK